MSYTATKGSHLNLSIYQGKSTIDAPIEIVDEFGSASDCSGYSSIVFKIFYRKHGDLIITTTVTNSLNVIYLDVTKAQTAALQTRSYWYECYGVLTSPLNEEELLISGFITNA